MSKIDATEQPARLSRWRRTILGSVAAAVTIGAGPATEPKPIRVPVFGSEVRMVFVNATVRDKDGAPVRGLKREDFTVLEDNVPQPVETFHFEEAPVAPAADSAAPAEPMPAVLKPTTTPAAAPEPAPTPRPLDLSGHRLVVLLFDVNSMEPEQIQRAAESARKYIDTRMSAADLVAIASIGTGLEVDQDFTADRALLRRVLDDYTGATPPETEEEAAAATDTTTDSDSTGFVPDTTEFDMFNTDRRLQAISQLADALAPIQQQKSVIYFSAGMTQTGADNQVQLRQTIDNAVKANLAVYAVDARGLEAIVPGGDARQASASGTAAFSGRALQNQFASQSASQDTLSALAGDTGGRAFFDTNDFAPAFERVLNDTAAYYVLGYSSTNPAQDGKYRRIKVQLKKADLRVSHRSGYYAGKDFSHSNRADREYQLQDQLRSDLSATDLPVWLQCSYFRVADTRYYVPLTIAIPGSAIPFTAASQKDRATLDILGVVRDEARRPVGRLRDTVRLAVEQAQEVRRKSVQYQTGFELPPGKYKLKVVVRENQSGAFGSFETDIRVPDLRNTPLKVSSVVLGTQVQPSDRHNTPNPLAREGTELVPSVTHVVSTHQPVYFYYEVYEPARSTGNAVRLLTSIAFFRGGVRRYETPLVEVTQLAAPDRKAAIFQFSVPAAALKPGFYVCQVNLIDDAAGTFTFPRLALLVR